MIDFTKSLIIPYKWRDEEFLIKRDDLLSTYLSGNKAYKAYFLLHKDFSHIVSFGGNQSNAMLSLAYIAKHKNARFTYFTKPFSSYLKNNIDGNLKLSLEFGMDIRFSDDLEMDSSVFAKEVDALYIPQGIACSEAKEGILKLAESILSLKLDDLCIFCSSGTGIMSFYLQQYLGKIKIFTTPCVGSKSYLQEQFLSYSKLDSIYNTDFVTPHILETKKKYAFAKPYKEFLEIYMEHLESKIEFDLLYDCLMWKAIEENMDLFKPYKHRLFLHSGGIYGNKTQLKRYDRAFLLQTKSD